MTMLEKMAAALFNGEGLSEDEAVRRMKAMGVYEDGIALAKAALDAIREPSNALTAHSGHLSAWLDVDYGEYSLSERGAGEVWTNMIDAIREGRA